MLILKKKTAHVKILRILKLTHGLGVVNVWDQIPVFLKTLLSTKPFVYALTIPLLAIAVSMLHYMELKESQASNAVFRSMYSNKIAFAKI